jgi:transcriptional regulator with XRE-family HTH domain
VSEISELLRKLRGKDSLREASKKTGISHNYISIIEKGVDPRTGAPINVTPDTLKSYSKGYHYDYELLMVVAGHIEKTETNNGDMDDPNKLRMLEIMERIKKENLAIILDFAEHRLSKQEEKK